LIDCHMVGSTEISFIRTTVLPEVLFTPLLDIFHEYSGATPQIYVVYNSPST
jgi:hypothetical protein